jgi:hypothetical protein
MRKPRWARPQQLAEARAARQRRLNREEFLREIARAWDNPENRIDRRPDFVLAHGRSTQ